MCLVAFYMALDKQEALSLIDNKLSESLNPLIGIYLVFDICVDYLIQVLPITGIEFLNNFICRLHVSSVVSKIVCDLDNTA